MGRERAKESAEKKYARPVHYEVVGGVALVAVGKKRDGKPRCGLAIVVYHFTDQGDAKSLAREHGRKVFRVEKQKRVEVVVAAKRGAKEKL